MSTRFKKGQSGNPAGRPKGAPNKITRPLKAVISEFLTEKFEELPDLWQKLDAKERARFLIDLLPYIIPRIAAVELSGEIALNRLTEEDIDLLALKLLQNENRE